MKLLFRKIQSFQNLSPRQKKILYQVFLLSIVRYLYRALGSKKALVENFKLPNLKSHNLAQEQIDLARDISKCILVADKYIPWNNVCRHQAWQAVWLLKKYQVPFTYKVGVRLGAIGSIEGHAWVMAGDDFITGYCATEEYKIIYTS